MRLLHVGCTLLILGTLPLGSGCATIMQGGHQQVSISSQPTGATVMVDGKEQGITPAIVPLSRKDKHVVSLKLDGYEPYEIALSRHVSGWVAGNIVFGGVIGLAVDAITGGMYKLSPEAISASMGKGQAAFTTGDGAMVVAVVLAPEPGWEKIGQLTRE